MKSFYIIVALVTSLSSCCSMESTVRDKVNNIEQNMTADEVRHLMGKADFRRFDQNTETWEYRTQLINGDYDVVNIEFQEGKVIRMDSFREIHPKYPAPLPSTSKAE